MNFRDAISKVNELLRGAQKTRDGKVVTNSWFVNESVKAEGRTFIGVAFDDCVIHVDGSTRLVHCHVEGGEFVSSANGERVIVAAPSSIFTNVKGIGSVHLAPTPACGGSLPLSETPVTSIITIQGGT